MQSVLAMSCPNLEADTIPPVSLIDPLPQLIEDLKDPLRRLAAIHEMGRLGPLASDALPQLRELFQTLDHEILASAAKAVGQMGLEAIPLLKELLKHPRRSVRREAVWALARLGAQAKECIPDLGCALRDPDPRTAAGAAQALANMGALAEAAIPDLLDALNSVNLIHSRLVAKALSNIGPKALPALVARLNDPRPFVRREIIVAIGFMGMRGGSAVRALIERFHQVRRLCSTAGESSQEIDEFQKTQPTYVLTSDFDSIGEAILILDTLGRIGPAAQEAKTVLQQVLHDHDPRLRHTAAQALLQITGWQ